VHGGPYVHGQHASIKLAGDDRLHGAEEAEDPLVHDPPAGVLRVGDVHDGIAGALLDGLCRGYGSAVERAMKGGASESGHGEPPPQHEVMGVEANGDRGRHGEAGSRVGIGDEEGCPRWRGKHEG
jgi:hypothetical protein